MRIAFWGPLSPAHTGIADYDEALLPLLRNRHEVDVFLPHRSDRKGAYPHWESYSRHREKPYDLSLYQIGNNAKFHGYMYGYAFQNPGAVVFHDYTIHHSRAAMLMDKGLYRDYRDELSAVYPQEAQKIADAVISFAAGNSLYFAFPFFTLLLQSSLAAAAHTTASVKELQITETPVVRIPHLELPGRTELPEDPFPGRFVLASFGFATRAKRISPVLQAVAQLRRYYPQILYLIAGEIEKPFDLQAEINRLGLASAVHTTGHVDDQRFLEYMTRADVILNLRYPSAGEMSGTLIRALSCGKPVLISRLPQLQEIPEIAVRRIRPDHEEEDLVRALAGLIENDSLRMRLGKAARKYIEQHHRPEQAVEKYQELIDAAIRRKPHFQRPVLPPHLQSAREIMRDYIRKTTLNGESTELLDWIL